MSEIHYIDFYIVKSSVHYPVDSSKSELLRQLKDTKADRLEFPIDLKSYDGDVVYSKDNSQQERRNTGKDNEKKEDGGDEDEDGDEEEVSKDKDECHNFDEEEYGYSCEETCPYVSLLLLSTKGNELKTLKLMTTNVSFMVAFNMGTESSETALRVELQANKLKDVLGYYLETTTTLSSKWKGLVSFENTGVVVSVAKDMPLNTLLMFPSSSIHSGVKSTIYKFTVSPVTCVKMYKRIFNFLRDNSSIVKNTLSPTADTTSFEWCLLGLSGNHRHLNGGAVEDWLNSDFITDSLILEGSIGSRNMKEYKEFCGTIKHGIVYRRRCSGQVFQIDLTSERFDKTDFIRRFVNRPQAVPSSDDDGGMTEQPEFICTFAKLFAVRICKLECLAINFTTISHSETIAFHLPSLDKSLLNSRIPSSENWKFVELKITEKVERDVRDARHRIEATALMATTTGQETKIDNIDDNPAISRLYEMFLIDSFVKHVYNICSKRHLFTDFCIHDGLDEKLVSLTDTSSSPKGGVVTLSSRFGIVSQMIKRVLISANSIDCLERVFDKYDDSLMFSGKQFNRHLRFLKKDDVRRFDNFSPAGAIHMPTFHEMPTVSPPQPWRLRKEIEMNVEKEFVTCALEHGIYFPIDRFTFQNRGMFFGNSVGNDTAAASENESHSTIYEQSIAKRAAPLRDNVFQHLSDSSLTNNFKYMRQFTPYVYDNKELTANRQSIEVDCCLDDSPPRFIPWTIARILQMSFENVCIVESKYLLEEFGETTHQKFASLCNLIDNHWVFKYDVDFLENCYKDKDNDGSGGRNQNLLRTLLVTSIEDLRKTSRVIVIFIYFDSEGKFSDDDLSVKCYLNTYSHKSNDLFSYIRRVARCGGAKPAINSQYFVYNTAVSYIVDAFLQSISNRLTNMSICHTFWQNHTFYVQRPHLKSDVITIAKSIVEEMDDRKMREYKISRSRDSVALLSPPWRSFLYKSDDILSSIKREPTLTGKLIASNKKGYIVAYAGKEDARRRRRRRPIHLASTTSTASTPNHDTNNGGGSSNTAIRLEYIFFSSIGTIHDYKEFWGNKKIMDENDDDCIMGGYNILSTGKVILDSIVSNCHLFERKDDYDSLLALLLPELPPSHFSIQASLDAEEYAAFKVDTVKRQQTTAITTNRGGPWQRGKQDGSSGSGSNEDARFAILQRDVIGTCYQDPEQRYVAGDKLSLVPVVKTTTATAVTTSNNAASTAVIPIVFTDFDPRYYRVERDYALDKYLKFSSVLSDILTTFFPEQAASILQSTTEANSSGIKEELGLPSKLHNIYGSLKSRLYRQGKII